MRALFWKDVRLNSQVLWIGVALLIAPYLIAVVWELYEPGRQRSAVGNWARILFLGSYYSLSISQLTLALLAGHTIAGERADRSAEFLAALPVSRGRILVSKAALGAVVSLVAWAVNVPVGLLTAPAIANDPGLTDLSLVHIAAGSLLVFGAAWFGSSCLESPTFAASLGVVAPLLVASGLAISNHFWRWLPSGVSMLRPYVAFAVAFGTLGLLAGTIHYLRRVEP